jgi:hypothetical protein
METKKINMSQLKNIVEQILKEEYTPEELNEISWGGLKSVGGMFRDKAKSATEKAGEAIKKGADDVKQAYKAGEDKAKSAKILKQRVAISQKITKLQKDTRLQIIQLRKDTEMQVEDLQKQYAALTGGKRFEGIVHTKV